MTKEDEIVQEIAARFPCFGGGRISNFNPITHWTKNEPPQFAAGVDIRAVVRFVLDRAEMKPKTRRKEK